MGQYHVVVNFSKREWLSPHAFGDGLKLWEQQGGIGGVQTALWLLLACSNGRGGGDFFDRESLLPTERLREWSGRWAGDRIAILGDYTEDGDIPDVDDLATLYDALREPGSGWRELSSQLRPVLEAVLEGVTYGDGGGWVQRTAPEWAR